MDSETEYWKNVAVYLAYCHAATYHYEGKLARTSANSRRRFRTICLNAAKMLRREDTYVHTTPTVEQVIARLTKE